MSKEGKHIDRRTVLKTVGSATITSVPTSTAVAGSDESLTVTSKTRAKRRAERAFQRSVNEWHRKHLDQEVRDEDTGPSSGEVGTRKRPDPRADVYIGSDTTLNPNYGDKYESDDADSAQDASLSASYDTGSEWVRGRAYDYAGWGTFRAWSYIAREFEVHGDSTQIATVTVRPDVCGEMTITGGGDNSAKLELIVKDFDDDERYGEYVFNHDGYVKEWCDDSYITSQNVRLEPGHNYTAMAKLTVGTTFTGDAGGALSDFNKNDGNETVDVGNIDIKF